MFAGLCPINDQPVNLNMLLVGELRVLAGLGRREKMGDISACGGPVAANR